MWLFEGKAFPAERPVSIKIRACVCGLRRVWEGELGRGLQTMQVSIVDHKDFGFTTSEMGKQ